MKVKLKPKDKNTWSFNCPRCIMENIVTLDESMKTSLVCDYCKAIVVKGYGVK